jgi:hypothetical protein
VGARLRRRTHHPAAGTGHASARAGLVAPEPPWPGRHVRRLLGQRRFSELYALAERATARPAPTGGIAAAIDTFLRTELLFRNNNPDRDCLVRSFSLYLYLQWLGFRVTHQIGIVPYPFDAHAWVELDGKPVLERVASMDRWHVISKLGQQIEQFAAMP